MSFVVLSSGDPQWEDIIHSLSPEIQDIHFLPEYGRIYESVYGYQSKLAVLQTPAGVIVQHFILRPVNELEFMHEKSSQIFYDFSHPYGYGGALASSQAMAEFYPDFYEAFHRHCIEQGYASEFCSLHPLLDNRQRPMIEKVHQLNHQKAVFSVQLPETENDLLAGFSQGHRRNYRKAIAAGVTIEKVDVNSSTLEQFREIHLYTMQRHQAASRWWFPKTYFPACHEHLGDKGSSIFFAYYKGELASACFLIHAFSSAYYHFGGSFDQFYDVRASNLLMTSAMFWAQKQGYKNFHLGGGVSSSDEDPLVRFKKGFGATAYPLYNYEKIHNSHSYEFLSEMKMEYEAVKGDKIVNPGYFPLYRRS